MFRNTNGNTSRAQTTFIYCRLSVAVRKTEMLECSLLVTLTTAKSHKAAAATYVLGLKHHGLVRMRLFSNELAP